MTLPRPTALACLALVAATAWAQPESAQPDSQAQRPLRRDAVVEIQAAPDSLPVAVAVEVADDPREQSAGLMHRRLASDAEGMLFVFPGTTRRAFWMHNTPASLDLLFLSRELRVVAVIPRAEPMSDQVLSPEAPAKYVLEVPGGFAERHAVGLGAQIRIRRDQAAPP
mgnify:CR=1 FL=1